MNWRRLIHLFAWLAFGAGHATAWAHNPDTSYAQVRIADERVALRLTYDLFTLQKITNLDADHDQRITRGELRRATPAIEKFLRSHVRLEINGLKVELGEAGEPAWPSDQGDTIKAGHWHTANGLIHFPFHKAVVETPETVALAFHFFDELGERHTVLGSFEQRGQPLEVAYTRPEPDYLFDTGFVPSLASRLARFLQLGIKHIFLGYDHICFLVALIVVSRFRELVKIVTSFTIAHTVTLMLAALQILTPPTRLIESGIAVSIVYVAAENLWANSTGHRWLLTFAFGLIHGFGFANVLRELGLPTTGTIRSLLAFNVGVELGQLAIVLALLPLSVVVARWRHGSKAKVALSLPILLLGLGWFCQRVFDINLIPF